MFSSNYIEINKTALENNLQFIRGLVEPNTRISSVVKGNAYGHGIEIFVPLAEQCGIDHFSVYSADEAYRTFKVARSSEIMIMGYIDNPELEWAINNDVEFYVFEMDRVEQAIATAKKLGKRARIHVELETGMNRTGFEGNELENVIYFLKSNTEHIDLRGLCSHFAGSENIANYIRVEGQYKRYKAMCDRFESEGLRPQYRHIASSAGTVRYPKRQLDLVRIGIMQYGFWPSRETKIVHLESKKYNQDPLQRVISWRSKVMSTKQVKRGQFIGYGTTYLAQHNMKVAIVPVGYSHGFSRSLSNTGRVLIKGDRLGVIGIVNMNALAVDVTNCQSEVKKGDEAVLIGTQGAFSISVSSFGELSDQLNYELLTRLPRDIPREITTK